MSYFLLVVLFFVTNVKGEEVSQFRWKGVPEKLNSRLLEIIGDYDWQSVEDYVDKNIDAYLN